MEKQDIYQDIAKRTDGDIYVGVVGPVRTGKSTFVKRFLELFVMPNIVGKNKKQIAVDEMPQSGTGKTITTTEPKFIPSEGVKVSLRGKTSAKVRLIDCVGYLVDGAIGHEENGQPRLVNSPWSDTPISFASAAEIGTEKVITDHSTVGVVVTTDGSITDIARNDYVKAEERAVNKLKEIGKPFVIVLNSTSPEGENCQKLRAELNQKYGVSVVAMDVLNSEEEKFTEVMEKILLEFPLRSVDITLPEWLQSLPADRRIIAEILRAVKTAAANALKMKDAYLLEDGLVSVDKIIPTGSSVFAGDGSVKVAVECDKSLFYDILSEECGESLTSEYALINYVRNLSKAKAKYGEIKEALEDAEKNGYGIVPPLDGNLEMGEPEVVKNGGRYDVRVRATSKSLHLIRVDVGATVNPISGTKKQCEDFIEFLKVDGEEKGDIASANVFGRPLGQLVGDEMAKRAEALPDDTKSRLKRTVTKMVNEGKYRIFCLTY